MSDEQTIETVTVAQTMGEIIETEDGFALYPVLVDGSQVALFSNRTLAEIYARGIRFGLDYGLPF